MYPATKLRKAKHFLTRIFEIASMIQNFQQKGTKKSEINKEKLKNTFIFIFVKYVFFTNVIEVEAGDVV